MKYLLTLLMLLIALVMLTCAGERRLTWYPALEESTVYSLTKNLAEARNHLELTAQLQQSKRWERAEQELASARQSLDLMEKYYFPLLNSRGHLAAAFHLSRREEIFKSKEEMVKARAQLTRAAANSDEVNAKEIEQISTEILNLQQALAKAGPATDQIFNQIAVKINKLINSQTQPII